MRFTSRVATVGGQHRLAARGRADGREQALPGGVLEQVPGGAGLDRAEDVGLAGEHAAKPVTDHRVVVGDEQVERGLAVHVRQGERHPAGAGAR
jgi:hypothetical protein